LIGKTQSPELFGHLDDQEEVLDALQPAGAIEQVEVDLAGLRRHDVGPGRDEEDAAVGAQVVRVEELVELVERRRVARCLPASRNASVVVMSTVSVPLFSRVPHSPLTLALPPPNGALNDAEAPVMPLRTSSSVDVPDRISPVSERVS
jgi:hypothetical protein